MVQVCGPTHFNNHFSYRLEPLNTNQKLFIARICSSLLGPLVNLPLDIIGNIQRNCKPLYITVTPHKVGKSFN
jgi:hypothetical protein